MHHQRRHQVRVETEDEEEEGDEEGTLDDYHQGNPAADAGWNAGFGDSWGVRPADSASNFSGNNWQHASVASPHQQRSMNVVNEWGIAAPSPPAKPVHMRQAANTQVAAHEMANMLTAALSQQQQAHNQELQRDVQKHRQQLHQMMQQQYKHHPQQPETVTQLHNQLPKVERKRDRRTSSSSHVRDANENASTWGNQGWGIAEGSGQGAGGPVAGLGWDNQGWGAAAGGGWANANEGTTGNAWPTAQTEPWAVSGTSITAGGFGSRDNAPAGTANTSKKKSQSPTMVQSQSWGGWNVGLQSADQAGAAHGETIPALVVTSPTTVVAETVPPEKRPSRSIGGFLSRAFRGRSRKDKVKDQAPAEVQSVKKSKTLKKQQKIAEPPALAWPDPEEEEEEEEEEEDWEEEEEEEGRYENPRNRHLPEQINAWTHTAAGAGWDNPAIPIHSKAYALASDNRVPPSNLSRVEEFDEQEQAIIEARGAALAPARRAFYSKERLVKYRIHWAFDPNKDIRVSALLGWIQRMQYDVAAFGFGKFLETRERGALFANADYRPQSSPHKPAFDWLTYNNVQATMDRTMQESLAFYDPNAQIVVFVFLLSKTQNSMAIWRRKLPLPDNLRLTYGPQLKQTIAGLQATYPIHVDEHPQPGAQQSLQRSDSNRKWFNWGRA